MSDTPTPITDAAAFTVASQPAGDGEVVLAKVARQLERDLAAATADADKWHRETGLMQTDMARLNQRFMDTSSKLSTATAEAIALRAERDELNRIADDVAKQLDVETGKLRSMEELGLKYSEAIGRLAAERDAARKAVERACQLLDNAVVIFNEEGLSKSAVTWRDAASAIRAMAKWDAK